jgi:hypothetical protein
MSSNCLQNVVNSLSVFSREHHSMAPKGNGLLHDGDYPDQNATEIDARMGGKR